MQAIINNTDSRKENAIQTAIRNGERDFDKYTVTDWGQYQAVQRNDDAKRCYFVNRDAKAADRCPCEQYHREGACKHEYIADETTRIDDMAEMEALIAEEMYAKY